MPECKLQFHPAWILALTGCRSRLRRKRLMSASVRVFTPRLMVPIRNPSAAHGSVVAPAVSTLTAIGPDPLSGGRAGSQPGVTSRPSCLWVFPVEWPLTQPPKSVDEGGTSRGNAAHRIADVVNGREQDSRSAFRARREAGPGPWLAHVDEFTELVRWKTGGRSVPAFARNDRTAVEEASRVACAPGTPPSQRTVALIGLEGAEVEIALPTLPDQQSHRAAGGLFARPGSPN